jgi:hypothetical protein
MKPRSHLPEAERAIRSRLVQLLSQQPLVCGSMVTMHRRCGKKNCHCREDEGHRSLYLAVRMGGRRRMLYVPESLEEPVRRSVGTWQEVGALMERLSQSCLVHFVEDKHRVLGVGRSPRRGLGKEQRV